MNHVALTAGPEIDLWIKRATGFIVEMFEQRTSGRNSPGSASLEIWIETAKLFRVSPIGIRMCPDFEAVLLHHRDRWQILFNRCATVRRQEQYICHELAEFIMVEYEPEFLILDFPLNIPREALRHEVAKEVVRQCCPSVLVIEL